MKHLSNYHSHTTFCDGKHTVEEMVQRAIGLGFTTIGFSGHSYTPFDESYCMSIEGTRRYKQEVRRIKEKYSGQIQVFLGVEQDYYSQEPTDEYDFIIGSVHYIKKDGRFLSVDESAECQQRAVNRHYGGDFYAFAEDYFAAVADVYRKTGCQIIGHFDLVAKFNENGRLFDENHPRYRVAAQAALAELMKTPAVFEFNTGAIARGYRTTAYPAPQFLEILHQQGKSLLFSSDCHNAGQLLFGWEAYQKYCPQDADNCNFFS